MAATIANIKIRYDAKTPQFAIFWTHVIYVFYSILFRNDKKEEKKIRCLVRTNINPCAYLVVVDQVSLTKVPQADNKEIQVHLPNWLSRYG